MLSQYLRRLFSKRVRIEVVEEGADKNPTNDQPQANNKSTQESSSSSPDNEKSQHATTGAQGHAYPITGEAVEISDSNSVSESKDANSPICIANYQDLLIATKHKPNLGRISEYPPQPRVIEGVAVDEIMAFFADAIRQSADDLPMERNEIDELFLPVVRRGLMYMHLLPASQFHHHNGIGGLFAHSLQVANLAVRLGKQKVFNQKDTPRELYQNGKRWLFGCWLAGFLHDIGKTVTDVTVTSEGETWYPYSSSLIAWLQDNNLKNYHFIWRSAGHNRHVQSTLMFVREIVPPKTFEWLADYGAREIWEACESALINTSAKDNLISEVVQQADEFTTGKDIDDRNQGKIDTRRLGGSLPAAEYIVDALQLLISEGTIEVNARGSILHVTTAGTFIIWTSKASELIYAKVLSEKHSSVPRKIDRMLDCLVTGGLVEPTPESFNGPRGYIWPVIYDMHPSQPLKSIKLRSTHVLFNGLVPPEPTLAIINGWEAQDPQNILAWEKKHGKLVDASMASQIPPPSPEDFDNELVNEADVDPDLLNEALPGEPVTHVSSVIPPSASCPQTTVRNQQETPEERAQFAAQMKAVLSGQSVIETPKPAPETTGGIPSNIHPEDKPSPQSLADIRERFASGDLSFLAPSLSTEDRMEQQMGVATGLSAACKEQPVVQLGVQPVEPRSTLSTTDILMGKTSKEKTSIEVEQNKLNKNPVVVSNVKTKDTKPTVHPAKTRKKPDQNRPILNGKPISKRPPQEKPKLSSELMAIFTGQATTQTKDSKPKTSGEQFSASAMDTQTVKANVRLKADEQKPQLLQSKVDAQTHENLPVQENWLSPEQSPTFSSGEENQPSAIQQTSKMTDDSFAEAALEEIPHMKRPIEKEKTFASKSEAIKHEKRMKTIESQKEQSLVNVHVGNQITLVDTNKTMGADVPIEKNHECKTNEVSATSVEVSAEKKVPSMQEKLMMLRQEIIEQLLAGKGSLFPSGLISVTDKERQADAEGIFERGKALGLDATKVSALASGFQPGQWKLTMEALNKRTVITLRNKAK